jgi:glycosyltransferase involved in cell wall biosynthesis
VVGSRPFVVACIPACNEERRIAGVIVDAMNQVDQVIVCDDGSTDMTGRIAEKLGATVITHTRNLGYGASIASLFEKAREMNAGVVVTLDADGQHNPREIPAVIQPIIDGQADIVIGSRFLAGNGKNVSSYRKAGIKTITTITNDVAEANFTDSQSGFRAYHARALNIISVTEQGMGASTEILLKAQVNKLAIAEVPITVTYDKDSSTHSSVPHALDVVMSTFKFVSIDHPLRFYGLPGVICLALATYFGVTAAQIYQIEHRLITNIALLSLGLFIIGLMLFMTSVILYVVINVVREPRRV